MPVTLSRLLDFNTVVYKQLVFNLGVTSTYKHDCVSLIYWSFIQRCYMFRLSTSTIIR